jgi:hypothetical protein
VLSLKLTLLLLLHLLVSQVLGWGRRRHRCLLVATRERQWRTGRTRGLKGPPPLAPRSGLSAATLLHIIVYRLVHN